MKTIEEAREQINEIDRKMRLLFEERMQCAEVIARYKKEHALPILDEKREKEVVQKNCAELQNPSYEGYYSDFLRSNMAISRAYQSKLNEGAKVAYCGVEGAFAFLAAKKMFPEATLMPFPSFESAYESTEQGVTDSCVLPLENSFAGDVGTVMDLIFSRDLSVNEVIDLEIEHYLIGNEGATLDSIRSVLSHPQALAQCSDFIKERSYQVEECANTAIAAKTVKESKRNDIGAIASKESANAFGLQVIAGHINESRQNTTRFGAFSKNKVVKSQAHDHFILVFTVKHEAGALAKTLDILGTHHYNMRSLRSRPMKNLLWQYYFYIEAEGNIDSEDGKAMLRELEETCAELKLAGTYCSK